MNGLASSTHASPHVVVIGAGFSGLAAAYELSRNGVRVTVVEQDGDVGGLAGSFEVGSTRLEKFYHHWFTSDVHVAQLISELGLQESIVRRSTQTGMYFANQFFRLSRPQDVLRFSPLSMPDRIRLGLLVFRARAVRDWQALESQTAAEWLIQVAGPRVYSVVWEPLLRGKFGPYANDVSAVWFCNKLKLRGSSRGRGGAEELLYFRGGFAALATRLADGIRESGGQIILERRAAALRVRDGKVAGVETDEGAIEADAVIATPALPILAQLLGGCIPEEQLARLHAIKYLANVCLVLELERSLSETYWLNVNDPAFPFVAVIEHTNFEPLASYAGRHIVYLSRYLTEADPMFAMSKDALVGYCLPHLQRMFPAFSPAWILKSHDWRARFAQPVVTRHYSQLIPPVEGLVPGLFVCTMAQVYPEDRGTNYAVRDGRSVGQLVARRLLPASS